MDSKIAGQSLVRAAVFTIIAALTSAMFGGCGPAIGTVTGQITIDGQPLDNGFISFVPADSNGEPVTVEVHDGSYQLSAVAGQKQVQISAPKVVGKRREYDGPEAPLVEITEERLPAKYNSQTELTYELKRGSNTKDWSVTSRTRPAK